MHAHIDEEACILQLVFNGLIQAQVDAAVAFIDIERVPCGYFTDLYGLLFGGKTIWALDWFQKRVPALFGSLNISELGYRLWGTHASVEPTRRSAVYKDSHPRNRKLLQDRFLSLGNVDGRVRRVSA
jgi:hypothetical protein